MSAEITIRDDGTAEAAFSLKPAWHELGKVFSSVMNSEDAITGAQLNWDVIQEEIAYRKVVDVPMLGGYSKGHRWEPVPQMVANIREDTGLFLGSVSDRYKVVQNVEAFQFMDDLIEKGEMEYESAFSLGGGKKVVITGRLPQTDTIVEGDDLQRYILFSTSHDGSGAIKFGVTSVRTVCANTLALALNRDGKTIKDLSVTHTGRIQDRLEQAKQILGLANQGFANYAGICRNLAERVITRAEWKAYLDVMCPVPVKLDPDWTERRERTILSTRKEIEACFGNSRQRIEGMESTAWSAYNAVSEYVDHLPRRGATEGRRAEARFNVTMHGPGNDQKQRAFAAACRVAELDYEGAVAV
jgi:phage/plasmid-like protein (TIGR03299 family)